MVVARGSYAKGVAKRREILDAALVVIARDGWGRTSVRALADAVGLSQAGLLHYFDSKEHLLAEVLRHRDETSRTSAEHDERATPDDLGDLGDLVAVVRRNADVPGLVRLHAQLSVEGSDPDHPAHAYLVERYAALRAALTAQVEAGQRSGSISTAVAPEALATLCIAVADGMQTQWLLDPSVDMAGMLQALLDLAATPAT